ncbi:MAG: hypothetical protein QM820_09440 [Minicystis sp.]
MLSQMFRQLFDGNPLTMLPTVGLWLFMAVFFCVSVSVLRRRASSYDDLARLPLADEEVRHER